jgi:pullulanase/glycogen debranching enzyme
LIKYSTDLKDKHAYATSPTQIVSYVEAHDNLTLWDKLVITNPDASVEELVAMHRMANAIVLTSQGIPHSFTPGLTSCAPKAATRTPTMPPTASTVWIGRAKTSSNPTSTTSPALSRCAKLIRLSA